MPRAAEALSAANISAGPFIRGRVITLAVVSRGVGAVLLSDCLIAQHRRWSSWVDVLAAAVARVLAAGAAAAVKGLDDRAKAGAKIPRRPLSGKVDQPTHFA